MLLCWLELVCGGGAQMLESHLLELSLAPTVLLQFK